MRITFLSILIAATLAFAGCASPQFTPELEGRVKKLETVQNGVVARVGNLEMDLTVQAEEIQNFSSNAGIQILQGEGGLVLIFGLAVVAMMLTVYYYHSKAVKNQKAAEVMGKEIKRREDQELQERVESLAMNTNFEDEVIRALRS